MTNDTYPLPRQKKPQVPSILVRPKTANPHPHNCFSGTREEWEEAIFRYASHFTVFHFGRQLSRFEKERIVVVKQTFPEAIAEAGRDPKKMVYAVTAEGRSFCIPRSEWTYYLQVWLED